MHTDLSHIPAAKQRELGRVVQCIFEEFGDEIVLAQGKRKAGRILKILLYGSYARGDWVDEPHTSKGYQSDFDLLIIVNQKELTDSEVWLNAEERMIRETTVTRTLRTPVNFIVHSLQEVNDALAQGRFFFMDVVRDAVALYQSGPTELQAPRPKEPEDALALAEEYFEDWFPTAMSRYKGARFHLAEGHPKDAAFDLHQTVERLYHTVLLVQTFYTPHRHNIALLRSLADPIDRRLVDVWPRTTRSDRAHFTKLRDAYVKARYSKHYRISLEELNWLCERVEELGTVVHEVCAERIAELKKLAGRG